MKKVAVFGNAGGGKSTLSRRLAEATGLPLHVIDKVKYLPGGAEIAAADYLAVHREILAQEAWVVDGFGCLESIWARLPAADTLVFLDLPLSVHVTWVTKRFLKSLFTVPEGWPEKSPVFISSLNSYRALWVCHRKLTPRYREYLECKKGNRAVYHLRSRSEITEFVTGLG